MAETPGKMYALATVLSLVAVTAVGLRLKARHIRKADLALDDYTILLALVKLINPQKYRMSSTVTDAALSYLPSVQLYACLWVRTRITLEDDSSNSNPLGTAIGGLGRHTRMGPHGIPILDRRVQVFQQVGPLSTEPLTGLTDFIRSATHRI